jgi:ABC-2 type transport system ATP-binding protein
MSDPVVRAEALSIRYGRRAVADGVSFDVPRGSVVALLGRNGAGKSSVVRCVVGLQRPDGGQAAIFGLDSWKFRDRLMRRVALVTEDGDAPPEMSVLELDRFCSSLYEEWDHASVLERLDRFGIAGKARYGELSKGERKQVSLALALAPGPELLVLDDPTLGLDVVARNALLEELVTDLADRGTTVFLTTHDFAGVERIADRVVVMTGGRTRADEELTVIHDRFRRIRIAGPAASIDEAGLTVVATRPWGAGAEVVVSNFDDDGGDQLRRAAAARGSATEVAAMSLEEIFLTLVGGIERSARP